MLELIMSNAIKLSEGDNDRVFAVISDRNVNARISVTHAA